MQLEVFEAGLGAADLTCVEGAFITNAAVGVLPVHALKGHGVDYEMTQPLPVIEALSDALSGFETEHCIDI